MICYSRGMHVVCKFTLSYFRLGVLMASVPRAAWRCVGAGMTDSRHYLALSAHGALRHTPLGQSRSGGDVGRIHGTDERAALVHFHRAMCTTRRVPRWLVMARATALARGTASCRLNWPCCKMQASLQHKQCNPRYQLWPGAPSYPFVVRTDATFPCQAACRLLEEKTLAPLSTRPSPPNNLQVALIQALMRGSQQQACCASCRGRPGTTMPAECMALTSGHRWTASRAACAPRGLCCSCLGSTPKTAVPTMPPPLQGSLVCCNAGGATRLPQQHAVWCRLDALACFIGF